MASTSKAAVIRELHERLRRADRGENGFEEGKEARTRLETLRRLKELVDDGKIERTGRPGGVNTHVHTAKSFSYFESPSDAVWHAYVARVGIFGINDHYTLAGHEEFAKACRILGIRPIFSLEAIAMWEEAEASGMTVNDPTNPGRTYLTAKGVTRQFPVGAKGEVDLSRMQAALLERHCEITEKLDAVILERLGVADAVLWEDVLALTPHDQPTERHICLAVAQFLVETYPDVAELRSAVARLVDSDVPADVIEDPAAFQNYLRGMLVKVGRPGYVEEAREAFIPVERLVSMALDLGAIPTYPVMGHPISPWEEDLAKLFDRLEAINIYAIEVIPDRNTAERLREIVEMAALRKFPIFNGTEHNTKTSIPLVDKHFFEEEFRPHFERGARVLLGHQALKAAGEDGYVLEDGTLPPGDREENLKRVEESSRRLRVS